jgi:exopolyphosphatase / guanosine-5'-triphosphate,3'-diphosphate pyrophosphatase
MINGYYGAIDIGTNAVRMVIKQVYEHPNREISSHNVQELRIPLRLGVDVFKYGFISEKKADQLSKTITCFKALFELYNVKSFKIVATSAMREASNSQSVIDKVFEETGYRIDTISGECEANTISMIATDCNLHDNLVFIDVGGGSTEVTLYVKDTAVESNSFPIGTLRILAKKDKKSTWKDLKKTLNGYYEKYGKMNIVGTGGNINRFYKISTAKKKKENLSVEDMKSIYEDLKKLSIKERIEKYKIKPDRADVIIPAGSIYLKCAEILKSKFIIVPMIGLCDALIDTQIEQNMDVI